MLNSKTTIDKKMIYYSFLMIFIFIIEMAVPYRRGIVSIFLYALTPIRVLICKYMAYSFDRENASSRDFKACIKAFEILTWIFMIDFLGNLVLTVPFPRHMVMHSFYFFMITMILEYVVSSIAYYYYYVSSKIDKSDGMPRVWSILNIIITILLIVAFAKLIAGENDTSGMLIFWSIILFLIREIMVIVRGCKIKKADTFKSNSSNQSIG